MFLLKTNLVGQPTGLNSFLTPEECRAIIEIGESGLRQAKTDDHQVHENLRKSEIAWLKPASGPAWLFDKVRQCVNELNANWFGYALIGLEDVQFTKYAYKKDGSPDFYASHTDTQALPGGTVRKLSFTVQLSEPESYEGGEVLLYNTLADNMTLSRNVGSISFFPSYTIHEVLPVTRGTRFSLVGWAHGPAFV